MTHPVSVKYSKAARSVPRIPPPALVVAWLVKEIAILDVLTFLQSMTSDQIDPEGACDRANRNLQNCLIEEGGRLADHRHWQQSLCTLFQAYALRPGATHVLNLVADVYDLQGNAESALCCRRGVIPENIEQQHFNASFVKKRIINARRASKCRHLQTHGTEKVALNLPASNGSPTERPEFRAKHTESRGSFVSVLQNAGFWFDGFNSFVVDSQQQILREHVKGNAYVVAEASRLRPEYTLKGVVCLLDSRSSSIFYHWMVDVLPKIAVLQEAGIDLRSVDHFIVRCQSSFQRQTLEQLGIPMERVVAPWSNGITRCKELLVPYVKHDRGDRFYNGLGLGMASWVPQWLKTVFLDREIQESKTRQLLPDKVYISRASRGTRSPVDEQKLTQRLSSRGFKCLTLENLTIKEQATAMAAASTVVAPHGAGLTNIAFCSPGTTIIEIFGDYVVPCYWALSELAGLHYHAYLSTISNTNSNTASNTASNTEKPSTKNNLTLAQRRNLSIDVDVDNLIAYIDRVMRTEEMAS